MTVIVQPGTDSNGNPQPMVYDQDTGKVIVDSNGFIVSGGQRLVNTPSKADYVSTPKTQTAGIQEACTYLEPTGGEIRLSNGIFYLNTGVVYSSEAPLRISGVRANAARSTASTPAPFDSQVAGGTWIIPSSSYPTNNMPLFTFLNVSELNNDGFIDIGNMSISGTYVEVGSGFPNGPTSSSAVGLQFGNTTAGEGDGPVAKYVHDMKIDNCITAIVGFSGGGPNWYDNLHVDGCGFSGTATINGSAYANPPSFIFYENSQHWGKLEMFNPEGLNLFDIYNSAGDFPPSILIDNMFTNMGTNGGFNFKTTIAGTALEIGEINVLSSANNGASLIEPPPSGSLVAYIANMRQYGGGLVQVFNSSSTAILDIAIGNYHATNSAYVVVTGSGYAVGSGSRLAISNAFLESLASSALTESIPGLTWTMAHVFPVQTPTLSANPPLPATVYQNKNPYKIRLKIPVTYNPTSTEAATLATAISPTSSLTTSTKVSIPAGLTSADGQILTYDMVIPAYWYYGINVTNATLGTAEVEVA